MRSILVFITIFISAISIAQIEITGTLTGTYYSQGGAYKEPDLTPFSLGKLNFYLIRVDSLTQKTTPYKIQSDSLGKFKISLPSGIYHASSGKDLILEYSNKVVMGYQHNTSWTINSYGAFLINEKTKSINVTRHESHICYMCP